ncbi:MAG TPA: HEAT repeat domain-containing protein [Candidatus Tripitaka californicus]|uniref:HEAT repeat domain-containing protein n=1 Tax=Candidatus Tripitaka californicus TaxID=3367616 RepID=UPI0040287C52|nr:HEAT repeat domain-containing protein [Planctomycetota bacterium]
MNETIKIFISSRQNELENERTWAKEAVEETGRDLDKCFLPILVEEKPTPPSTTTNTQCHEDLKESKAVIYIYYKTISEIVKNEFRWANERGIPIFIFKKEPQGKDRADGELKGFVKNEIRPPSREPEGPYGIYVHKTFDGRDIKDEIRASLKKYYPTWFNFMPIPEEYLPSKVWPGKLEIIRKVYVKPRCYSMAEEILKSKRLLIITGPAHIGKTSMGFHLADSFQKNNICLRFLVFPERGELYEIANHPDSIILLDDPFGGSTYHHSPIGDRPDIILGLAHKNHIIITSRREVLEEAVKYTKLQEKKVEDYMIEMTEGDYGDEDFKVILKRHLKYYKAGPDIRALANSHTWEILQELRFPHNYERLTKEELRKVIEGKKDFQQALKDAKEIEKAVGNWFEAWLRKDKEVFYFLLILAVYGKTEEEDFKRIYKKCIKKLNHERELSLPLPGNLVRLRKDTASYVSQSGFLRLEHPSYRNGIISVMIKLYLDDTISVLSEMVGNKSANVRSRTINTLVMMGELCPKRALPILERLTKDKVRDVSLSAIDALGKIGKKHSGEVFPILEKIVTDRGKDPNARFLAACMLAEVGNEEPSKVIQVLGKLAKEKDENIRWCAAWALQVTGEEHLKESLPILEKLTWDKDPGVRSCVAEALEIAGERQPSKVLPVLEKLAKDKEPIVRYHTRMTLEEVGEVHPKKVLHILEKLFRDTDSGVRSNAAEALEKIGRVHRSKVLPILKRLANSEDPSVHLSAREVLRELGSNKNK